MKKKLIEKTIEGSEKILRFASDVFGPSAIEGMGIMKDRLELARWERKNRLVDRYFEIKREREISGMTSAPPPLFALQILENATLEEDDYIQDIWIRLLQNLGVDAEKRKIRKAFIDVIRQLEPIDAKILETVYNIGITRWKTKSKDPDKMNSHTIGYSPLIIHVTQYEIERILKIESNELLPSLDNLYRLRCLAPYIEEKDFEAIDDQDFAEWHTVTIDHHFEEFQLTSFGLIFVEVCVVE